MIAVIPTYKMEAQQMLDKLIAGNVGSDFTHEVYIPFDDLGHLEFDLKAPKKLLVITAVNGQRNNRKVDKLKP
jgi:subtilisin-like proprotein convertase family protein